MATATVAHWLDSDIIKREKERVRENPPAKPAKPTEPPFFQPRV